MEALRSLGVDWKLLIAQIINFLIILFVLKKFLFGPIVNLLTQRKKKIEQGLKDADEAKKHLEEANQQTRKLLADASAESEKIVKAAKSEIEQETKDRLEKAQNKSEEIIRQSRLQAAREQEQIVNKAKKEISDLAVAISEKILEREAGKETIKQAIEKL